MAILAPGVAQFRIVGHIDGLPWNSLVYFVQTPSSVWSGPQLIAGGNAILTGMASVVNTANFHTTLTWDVVQGVDLGSTFPAIGNSTHAALAGTSTNMFNAASCIMINYGIGARYRGGKPRTYLPGMISLQQLNSNTWISSTFNTFVAAWSASMAGVSSAVVGAGAAVCTQCVPTYNYAYTDDPARHRYTKQRVSYKSTLIVGSITANPTIRTQRRRLT